MLPHAQRVLVVLLVLLLAAVIAVFSALGEPGAESLAWWWPAAGVSVVAGLASDRRMLAWVAPAAGAVTAGASLLAERPPAVVLAVGIGAAAETLIVALVLGRRRRMPQLESSVDVGLFLGAALAGASAVGAAVAVAVALTGDDLGGGAASVFLTIGASHLSAVLLITPVALISQARGDRGVPWRALPHMLGVIASVCVAFGPWAPAPLAFLPVPLLAWAAFSGGIVTTVAHVLVATLGAAAFTLLGYGPFVHHASWLGTGTMLQIYAIAISSTCLLIAGQQNEKRRLEQRAAARRRLIDRAYQYSTNGFAILQEEVDGRYRAVEVNSSALALLAPGFQRSAGGWRVDPASALGALLVEAENTVIVDVDWEEHGDDHPPASVRIEPVVDAEFGRVLLVAVDDLTPVRAASIALETQLARERAATEALRDLNAQQDAFVASVTHELRTPITSIIGYADVLEADLVDDSMRGYVQVITRNALRLNRMVDNVLRAATLRSSTPADGADVIEVTPVVTACLDDLWFQLSERALRLQYEVVDELQVRADETDLHRIVANLLTNAVKFSPHGGRLLVRVAADAGDVVVTIDDDGPGIAPEDLGRVFERFYRSPQAIRDSVPGTGIGLSVAQGLAEVMTGAITLRPRDEGGTRAVLRVPSVPLGAAPGMAPRGVRL